MQKLYCLLFLFFAAWHAQGQSCSVSLEAKDSIGYAPFAHYVTFKVKAESDNHIIKKVCWKFGDGTEECHEATPGTSGENLLSIKHKYQSSSAGLINFNACVIVYFDGGCVADKCISIPLQFMSSETCYVNVKSEVLPNTSNGFLISAITGNSGGKKPVQVCWKFGDGSEVECHTYASTYTGTYVADHRYVNPGTYEACVTVKFDGGCEAKKCIVVTVPDQTCTVGVRTETVNGSNNAFLIAAIPQNNDNKPVYVCWKFGDGSEKECHQYAATYTGTYVADHHYAEAGTYEACVTVVYQNGCEAKKCIAIIVPQAEATCSAGIRFETAASNPLLQYMIPLPENSQHKKPVEICWKFGDGSDVLCKSFASTYTGTYALSHTYAQPGQYEVCVEITYDGGCEAHKCTVLNIASNNCAAELEIKPSQNDLVKNIFVLPKAGDRKPASICWTFGDGSDKVCKTYGGDYTGTYVAEHAFPKAGEYNVCTRVEYAGGCVAEKCTVVKVKEAENRCEVKLGEIAGSVYNFERKFYAGLMDGRRAEKICWRFSDGSAEQCVEIPNPATAQSLTMSHAFPGPGEYQACIRVVYAEGCVAEKCITVIVRSEQPEACGGYMVKKSTGPRSVSLKGFAIPVTDNRNATFSWTFGDGSTGSGKQVEHEYEHTGEYEVCLQIKSEQCTTTICRKINVGQNERPRLILSPNPASSIIHAQFFSTRNENVSIRIYNANGLLLKSFTRSAALGENNWDFEIGTLPTGVYSMVVRSNYQFANAIFFKQ